MAERWLEIEVLVEPEEADDVRATMARWAGSAVVVHEPGPGAAEVGLDANRCRISAYLPEGPEFAVTKYELLSALWHLSQLGVAGASAPAERWTHEDEWYERWKRFYVPVEVGGILIVPAWDDAPTDPGALVVRLDPGQAFGTGLHVSTRQALSSMQRAGCRGRRVLDLGCGSGVLSIAAARLGACEVVALDSDARAVASARSNVELNGVRPLVKVIHGSLGPAQKAEDLERPFDLVVSNIVASVHCELAGDIIAAANPGAPIVLGGIVADRARAVIERFEALPARVEARETDGEWVTLVLRRTSVAT